MTSIPPPGPQSGVPEQPAMLPNPVEWQLVERVPGDPWSVELMVWSGEAIEGIGVPVDDALLGALGEVRRRRAEVAGTFTDPALPADTALPGSAALPESAEADLEAAEDPDPDGSRLGRWWQGLGRTTGSTQADRWLANVPVKWQLAGAALLLLVFVLVMVIGRLIS